MGRETLRFTDEQIEQANSVNIISYARDAGYPIKQVSAKAYKIEGYGGLYVHSDGHKWNWFSQGKGGGTIQFVMEMEGKTWVEAIKQLIGIAPDALPYVAAKMSEDESIKGEFILPEKNKTYKHIFAYLIKTRGIEKEVVYDIVKKGKVYENKYKSCVFVGYDKKGEARYANVRSTNTSGKSFRCDVKNSDKAYPFCVEGDGDTLCVFESPIDLMSYLTLLKKYKVKDFNNPCISLGGVAIKPLDYYLQEHPNISNIMLCLDNDEAGHFSCQQIRDKHRDKYKILRHLPKGKDFNEDLISLLEKSKALHVGESQAAEYGEDEAAIEMF